MKHSLFFLKPLMILILVLMGFMATSCENTEQKNVVTEIPFSHKTHIEKYNIEDCGTCHKYDEYGTFRGLPAVEDCTVCHDRSAALTNTDHMTPRKKTVFDSYTDKDSPWKSTSKDPELFYYSHKVVLTTVVDGKKRFRCDSCHGDKVSSNGKANLKGEMLMKQCIECHTAFKMNNQCDICHR